MRDSVTPGLELLAARAREQTLGIAAGYGTDGPSVLAHLEVAGGGWPAMAPDRSGIAGALPGWKAGPTAVRDQIAFQKRLPRSGGPRDRLEAGR